MACEISFYHLTQGSLDKSVAKLLEKGFEAGHRSILVLDTQEELDHYNKILWTFSSLAFVPHGSDDDGDPAQQPLYLTTSLNTENPRPNQATILATVNANTSLDTSGFKRCLDIFNGHDDDAVTKARARWKSFKASGHKLTYWKQDENGRWFQEASSS